MRRVDDSIRENETKPTSRRVSPASVFGRRPRAVARLRLPRRRRIVPPPNPPVPPPTPTPNTRTHTGFNAPRLRKTTRCLPREIKNKNTYPCIIFRIQQIGTPITHTVQSHMFGHTETGRRDRRPDDDASVVRSSPRRAFVRSIDRSRASIATATFSVLRSRARGDVEEEERGVDVVAVVPIERPRDRTTRA